MEVVRVESLSKLYDLGQVGTGTLSRDLNRWWAGVRGKQDPYARVGQTNDRTQKAKKDDAVWALKDINFSVNQGEVVGIVGRNGAGKSTLLKVISRITTPTTGTVKVKGRIASLLEVGTGFHPDMTGRENIFMNGTLLGMTRREIQAKLDEIVDFAGVAMYIDTPVKRYSSGMQVRLGFAVAAFLEPEILIVDEVLAVGDQEFQKKAIGRMQDVSKGGGRTVIFVSHNIVAMKALCKKGIWMHHGEVRFEGLMNDTIEKYLSTTIKASSSGVIESGASSINTGIVRFTKVLMLNLKESVIDEVNYLSPIYLHLELEADEFIGDSLIDVRINTIDGLELVHTMNKYSVGDESQILKGQNVVHCEITNNLQPGKYNLTIGIHNISGATLDYVENIVDFTVLSISDGENPGLIYPWKLGYVRFESKWKISN